jgi:hypothetical protein
VTRICFIGNSHIATAKFGWDAVEPEFPQVRVTFFGARAAYFADTAIEGGRLVAKSEKARLSFVRMSRGQDFASLADYDVVVLIALEFGLWRLADVYSIYRWEDQNNSEGDFDFISTDYLDEIARARLIRTTAVRYRSAIRAQLGSHAPMVLIYPEPMPSETALDNAPADMIPLNASRLKALRQASRWGDEAYLHAAYARAAATFSGNDGRIFIQPEQTCVRGIFTHREYSAVAAGWASTKYPQFDFAHMNAGFGALMVRQILQETF